MIKEKLLFDTIFVPTHNLTGLLVRISLHFLRMVTKSYVANLLCLP